MDGVWRFSQFAFFGKLVLRGDFPIQSSTSTWHNRINRLKPHAPIERSTECAQFVKVNNGGVLLCGVIFFMRDKGCSLSLSLYFPSSTLLFCDYEVIMV